MFKFLKWAGLGVLIIALIGGALAYRYIKELGAIASGMVSYCLYECFGSRARQLKRKPKLICQMISLSRQ